MSTSTSQAWPKPSSSSQPWPSTLSGIPPECHHNNSPNTVRPNEPNGTRPISTLRPDNFSQSSEPRAIPTENTVRIKVTTVSSPCIQSLAYAGICVR
ncbi:hypothetical protein ALO79_200270 [Pseudomonas syringae pv. castaneae]|uniref:Uncharacterized protein n=1 Tax=Pseudomonas syringae pv. castaneae TaxID=264450 RepID=A0A0P9S611_PSESX|nr:hypothetical protein ALO79_200270 [Pseudomonas syringae pv. castaneae]